jgi:AcrR family transcriptional regulator
MDNLSSGEKRQMARQTDASAAPRIPLSKERVLRAAIVLADAGGIEALSMRRLAKELGVEAMSLYNHVANKDEILAGIIDLVAGEIETPEEADWKTAIRRNAISARDVYLRHRWASGLQMSRQSGGPAGLRRADWLLRTLREAGVSKELTYRAFHMLEAYILGSTVQQLNFPYKVEELAGLATTFLQQLPADEYPDFVEHVRQHLEPRPGEEGGFELGLDLILDGLERARDAA